VIELPQNADPDKVHARYTNGCLSITVGKREASKSRAITVTSYSRTKEISRENGEIPVLKTACQPL